MLFQACVNVPEKTPPAIDFVFIEGDGEALLGKRTATDLGILSIKALSSYYKSTIPVLKGL